jgi:hypothetical protein
MLTEACQVFGATLGWRSGFIIIASLFGLYARTLAFLRAGLCDLEMGVRRIIFDIGPVRWAEID